MSAPFVESVRESETLSAEDLRTFRKHVDKWRKETRLLSSITRKIAHPDYLAIISMGEKALPLLLWELEARPTYWFAALKAIATSVTSEIPKDQQDFDAAVAAWLKWGEERGYLKEQRTQGT